MSNYPISIPDLEIAKASSSIIAPMLEQILDNIHQNQTLSKLRDALLPKLMSGQLRLTQAQTLVEAAV